MRCKKRRRYRLATVVSYLCTFIGFVFIVSNVIMLRQGFVQLYSTTFGHQRAHVRRQLSDSRAVDDDGRAYVGWRQRGQLPVWDIPRIELPSSVLVAELYRRKLMANQTTGTGSDRTVNDRHLSRFLHDGDRMPSAARSPDNRASVVSVSSRDLRHFLYVTSECAGLGNALLTASVVGSGWTKVVHRATYKNRLVALKTVDLTGHDLVGCMKAEGRHHTANPSQCYETVVQKLLKEILLLRGLDSQQIVRIIAHCVPNVPFDGRPASMVSMATELGEGVDVIRLLRMSWEDRLKICYGLCKLLHYLAHSPYGSAILTDFRRQQFVLIDGDIKLTDIDDIGFTERSCLMDVNCQQTYSNVNVTVSTKCIRGRCLGLNEKMNIFNVGRHFTTFLLPHGAPRPLLPALQRLVYDFSNVSKSSDQLLADISDIIAQYSNGSYLNRTESDRPVYRVLSRTDMPGSYDYHCRYCMDRTGCTLSVYDVREAEELCDADVRCKAFVFTDTNTWTGRVLVHFKSGIGRMTRNTHTSLHIKPDRRSVRIQTERL